MGRGGKTRALSEIAQSFRGLKVGGGEGKKLVVIRISCNAETPVDEWEQEDPLGALCRRIAFAGMINRNFNNTRTQFEDWKKVQVSSEAIVKWLDGYPCLLLVDELNKLTLEGHKKGKSWGPFFRDNFLAPLKRYLGFTSHLVTTTMLLREFMSYPSGRNCDVCCLPLIPSLDVARQNLSQDLTARKALFYGLVPSLIYEDAQHGPPSATIQILKCQPSEENVRKLLGTFIIGGIEFPEGLSPLLSLMSVVEMPAEPSMGIRWIPFHMVNVLEAFSMNEKLSPSFARAIQAIATQLRTFRDSKFLSGEGWEALFVVVILICCISGKFHRFLWLPNDFQGCEVTYNSRESINLHSSEDSCLFQFGRSQATASVSQVVCNSHRRVLST